MILVDTNVISEPLRSRADLRVVDWLDRQSPATLYVSTISVAEILFGVESLAPGSRRQALQTACLHALARLFGERIVGFDLQAARAYATLKAEARRQGLAIAPLDGQIAGIAACRGFAVATRDESPFRAAGLATINPWTD